VNPARGAGDSAKDSSGDRSISRRGVVDPLAISGFCNSVARFAGLANRKLKPKLVTGQGLC
jgi:hypothetical protein